MVTLDQSKTPEKFTSQHYVQVPLADDLVHLTMTGVIIIDEQGNSERNWKWEEYHLYIDIPIVSSRQRFMVHYWAPFVTINSVYNRNVSNDSGFAVDYFYLKNAQASGGLQKVHLVCGTAVRDTDAYLYRIGYSISLTGKTV